MQFIIASDYQDMSRRAADLILDSLEPYPAPTMVFPTGNTPLGLYRELAARVRAGAVNLSHLKLFQLDEYAGIPSDDWRTLAGWLKREFIDRLDIPDSAIVNFDPTAVDRAKEALAMDRAISAAGGLDVQVLGLGLNGHIGFNEPGSTPDSPTRVVDLTVESVRSNAVYWGDQALVPRQAFTLGLGILSTARKTVLLVSGAAKAGILAEVMNGPITPQVPATFLRGLANVTIIADQAAAAATHLGADHQAPN